MKKLKIFMIFLCFNAASFLVSADPQTCPADSGGKCSGPDDWEGEFFPEIPHIKYEGPKSSNPLTYKWYNAEEEILGKKMKKSNKNLDEVIELAKELQKETKIRPLWGTVQLFLHPRYMHEEQRPKPQEPTKHQYDWDAATAANFLRKYGLINEFKLNIECNHARLSGHTCHHELETARINGLLGNIDANTGDAQTGWDTDQFLTDVGEATMFMMSVLRNDGIAPGGFNLDAKLRRESTDVEDLFIAHISGMDTLARGLRNAVKLLEVN
ncbi:hypothetical protein Bca52824_051607 [Brassica carinata]|uniref:xylose isomerase n=1 Tax=Brassica carinata TaxID=52824 RepID=A0A8X7R2D7_BRACI|nr:hypothetical protein Bca52824_051607 [Brassica carinata]